MARPLRIEFPGAVYHVTSRGNRKEQIFTGDADRELFLHIVDQSMARLEAEAFAFCLMGNHYHFVVRTRQANLSRLMRQINGTYTQAYNKRHGLTGHIFQGRFHAVLVDRDAHLVEVCRYVELNPVRACLVEAPADWRWSSHRAHVAIDPGYAWLATGALHGHLLGRDVRSAEDTRQAIHLWIVAVAQGLGVDPWMNNLRAEIFLGDEQFVARMQALATRQRLECDEIARVQRTDEHQLSRWLTPEHSKPEAYRRAYTEGGMTMAEIGRQAGLTASRVSRLISTAEELCRQDLTPTEARPDPS